MKAARDDHSERFVTEGAKDLRAWLTKRNISVPTFCEEHDLDRIEVQRIMNGERQRVTCDMAVDICDAVAGDIDIRRFAHTKAMRKLLFERRSILRKNAGKNRAA